MSQPAAPDSTTPGSTKSESGVTPQHHRSPERLREAREQLEAGEQTETHRGQEFDTDAGRIEVRCPSCKSSIEIAADTSFTELTCSSCGSRFSLIDQGQDTHLAPSIAKMGRFELIERLGLGNFGTVWKARDKELDRTVAIKVPRRGGMTPEEQEKFLREARAAAQLRHDNIVSVYEVGREGDSVFIVSEFIRGVTLGEWLDGQQLNSREAAELGAKIAKALDHAHQKKVIHRDLKPANIMMDGEGEPHVMDFGLARREVGEVTVTVEGQLLGTPAYMSPEQAMGESHSADRRSDVYSLGVILFQMLTGEFPFRGNVRMIIHQVINDEPPSPRKLNATVPKDLETITLKCLEKQPSRRYHTAQELADELGRYLRGEPILARPVGRVEQVWRWARRKPAVAGLGSALFLTFCLGTLVASYFAVRASSEAAATKIALKQVQKRNEESETVNKFLVNDVLGLADLHQYDYAGITLLDALAIAEKSIGDTFANQPAVEAVLRERLGVVFISADRPIDAISQLRTSIDRWQVLEGPQSLNTLRACRLLATALRQAQHLRESHELFQTVYNKQKLALGAGHEETVATAIEMAVLLQRTSASTAVDLSSEIFSAAQKSLGSDHPRTLEAHSGLAWSLRKAGRTAEAFEHAKAASARLSEVLGKDDWRTGYAFYNLGVCLEQMKHHDEAATCYQSVLDVRNRSLGPIHCDTLWALARLVNVLIVDRREEEAESVLHRFQPYFANISVEHAMQRREPLYWIAESYGILGDFENAAEVQDIAFRISKRCLGETDVYALWDAFVLSRFLFQAGDSKGGLQIAKLAVDRIPRSANLKSVTPAVEELFVTLEKLDIDKESSELELLLADLQRRYERTQRSDGDTKGETSE